MSDLSNQTPADTYKGLLQVNDYTDGVNATAKYIQDGEGTDSALAISTDNVGIGTTSPDAPLHIVGTPSSTLILERDSADVTAISSIILKDGSDDQVRISSTDSKFRFETGASNTPRMLVDSNGNVGIGTTSPALKLHCETDAQSVARFESTSTAVGAVAHIAIQSPSASGSGKARVGSDGDDLYFSTLDGVTPNTQVSIERMRIDSNGNVGIGTASPDYKLDVQEATNGTYAAKIFNNGGDSYGLLVKTSSGTDEAFPILDLENTAGNVFRVQANGNVGIGTTSPSEKLHVSGNAIITGDLSVSGTTTTINTETLSVEDHQIILGTLSSGTPTDLTADDGGIVLKGDTDKTILWSNDTDAWRCNQNFIADGNVGIGTTDPGAELEVNGQIISNRRFMSEDSLELVSDYNDNSSTSIISFKIDGQGAGNEKMRIDSDGNVGIGTTSPDAKLEINAGTNDAAFHVKSSDGFVDIKMSDNETSDGGVRVSTKGNNLLLQRTGGNVGIGTTSPSNLLELKTATGSGNMADIALYSDGGNNNATSSIFLGQSLTRRAEITAIRTGSGNSHELAFSTNGGAADPEERMRIDSAGNVGIGTTSPDPNVLLHVQGKVGTTNGEEADPTHTFYSDPDTGMFRAAVDTLAFSTGGVEKMRIDSNGNVGIGTTSPDAKLEVKSVSNLHMRVGNTDQETSPIIRFQGQSSGGQNHYADIQLDAETGTLLLKDPGTSAPSIGQNPVAIDSNGNVGIGTTSPDAPLHILTSNTTDTLLLEATSDVGLNAPDLTLYRNSASPAVDDKIGVVKFRGKHSGGGTKDYANIQGIIVDPTNTSEDSKIAFEVRTGGTLESRMEVGPDKVEVSSTTGGMVMPRMTTTERTDIASPINGEMVYDTDLNKFYGYADNAWTPLH